MNASIDNLTLPPGAELDGLIIEQVLAQAAQHATYLASDPAIGRRFVLREYLPRALSRRDLEHRLGPREPAASEAWQDGLAGFTARARRLARLDHPGLAQVLRLIEANGTAYLVTPWYPGEALLAALPAHREAGQAGARDLVLALMDALAHLHEHGQVHGAISPARIRVDADGAAVLLPGHVEESREDVYAAPEQQQGRQPAGPAADLYRLAATLYHAFTGVEPPSAAQRQAALQAGQPDPLASARQYLPPARHGGLADALDQGLALDAGQRPSSAEQWRRAFASIDWRLQAMRETADSGVAEERDRLPLIVFAVLLALVLAIGLYLLRGGDLRWPGTGEEAQQGAPQIQPQAQRPTPVEEEERRQWQAALQADTVLGYRRFMASYPDSIYRDQAQVQLNILDEQLWERLSAEDTRPAYEDYLQQFPAGLHEAAALRRIEQIDAALAAAERQRLERERQDNAAWDEARAERSIASMQGYIDNWPAGLHIEEAQRTRRQLLDRRNDDQAFEAARALDRRDAYQSYLDAFPGGAHVTAALQAIDDLTLRPGKTFRDCPECPEMVVVPAGTFLQGAGDDDPLATPLEKPRRRVNIPAPFAAGSFEVTMAQWDACVADGGCSQRPGDNGWGRGERPVMMVSWSDALQYTGWLGKKTGQTYRLPSESEWEYLARAGATGNWPFDDPALVCQFANIAGLETEFQWRHPDCADPVALGTLPVGSLRPNDFGLFDMIGNVAEWTADCMNLSYLDAPTDGSAWTRGLCSSHMARGGSWVTGTREIRLPARFNLKNGDRNDFTGFRVVRSVDE